MQGSEEMIKALAMITGESDASLDDGEDDETESLH
jgi:hypothetical protein